MNKKAISILTAMVMVLSSSSCGKKDKNEKKEVSSAINVETYKVTEDSISSKVTYTGELKASQSVSVSSKVNAKAMNVAVKEGDYVNAGDVLLTLDKTDILLAYEQAEASYNSAIANYNMMKNATAKRNKSQATQNVDTAQIAYDAALTNYNRELSLYNQNSNVKLAEQKYNDAVDNYNRTKSLYDNNSTVITAKNAYDTASENFKRAEELYNQGAMSKVEFDNAKNTVENAKASFDSVEANSKSGVDSAYTAMLSAEENLKTVKVTARAGLDNAEANLNNTKNALNIAKENVGLTDITNQESIETASATVDSAKASLNIAKNNLNNTQIIAPISGYISTKNVNEGQMVAPGVEIFSIKNSNTVDAQINVTESVISNIYEGTKAYISVKSANIEDLEGVVTLVNPIKNEQTGMYTVKVTIENDDDILRVGMFADITLVTEHSENTLIIPSEAIMQSGEELYVYVAEDDKAIKKTITKGIEDDGMVQILSGLDTYDEVIVSGKDYISDTNNMINIVKKYEK